MTPEEMLLLLTGPGDPDAEEDDRPERRVVIEVPVGDWL